MQSAEGALQGVCAAAACMPAAAAIATMTRVDRIVQLMVWVATEARSEMRNARIVPERTSQSCPALVAICYANVRLVLRP
jgi:hypothetical protein